MAVFVPPRRSTSPRSRAERRILEWLARLDDRWTVLHSLGITNHPFKQWAEIDVVAIGPPGLIALEVKGGKVVRKNGLWGFEDHTGRITWKSEGPFDQVGHAHAALRESLLDSGALTRDHVTGYAVATPDVPFDHRGQGILREVLIDSTYGWADPAGTITRWCDYWADRQHRTTRLDTRVRACVVDALRGDLDLVPTLSLEATAVRQDLTRLTAEQERILEATRADNPRLSIVGRAGTGKSMLALAEAHNLADEGARTLFLCHSRPLAQRVGRALVGSGVTVMAAPDRGREAFDAVVIDEAQDFGAELPDILETHASGGLRGGRWRVFLDPAQAVLGTVTDSELTPVYDASTRLRLSLNCRNTREIAIMTSMLTRIDMDVTAPVNGPPVDTHWWVEPTEHDDEVARELRRLTEALSPESVVLLTHTPLSPERARRIGEEAGTPLSPLERSSANTVVYATASEFKGLEADAVVVADVRSLSEQTIRNHFYVACTRARVQLSVFLHRSLKSHYDEGALWLGRHLAGDTK